MIKRQHLLVIISLILSFTVGIVLLLLGIRSLVDNLASNRRVFTWEPTFFGGLLALASSYVLFRSTKLVMRIIALVYLIMVFTFIFLLMAHFPMSATPPVLQYLYLLFILIADILLMWQLVKEFQNLGRRTN